MFHPTPQIKELSVRHNSIDLIWHQPRQQSLPVTVMGGASALPSHVYSRRSTPHCSLSCHLTPWLGVESWSEGWTQMDKITTLKKHSKIWGDPEHAYSSSTVYLCGSFSTVSLKHFESTTQLFCWKCDKTVASQNSICASYVLRSTRKIMILFCSWYWALLCF